MKKDRVAWADQEDDEDEGERREVPVYPLVLYSEHYVSCNYFNMQPVGFLESNADAMMKLVNKNINNLINWRNRWDDLPYATKRQRAKDHGHQRWAPGKGPSYDLDRESATA